jgi:hypothetical protein
VRYGTPKNGRAIFKTVHYKILASPPKGLRR